MRASTQRERREERKAYVALRRAVRDAGISVSYADGDKDGNYVVLAKREIVLRAGMSLRETLYVLAHEFGHVQSNLGNFAHVYAALEREKSDHVARMATVVEELDAWALAYQFIPKRLLVDAQSYAAMCLKTYTSRKMIKKAEKLRRK